MRTFDHPNVMQLTGICWANEPEENSPSTPPLIVLPYMELGDLKNYLKKYRLAEARGQVFRLLIYVAPVLRLSSFRWLVLNFRSWQNLLSR